VTLTENIGTISVDTDNLNIQEIPISCPARVHSIMYSIYIIALKVRKSLVAYRVSFQKEFLTNNTL
jgi:hypothetical protein